MIGDVYSEVWVYYIQFMSPPIEHIAIYLQCFNQDSLK